MRYGGVTAEFLAIEVEKKMILPPIHKVSPTKKRVEPIVNLLSDVALQPGPRRTVP